MAQEKDIFGQRVEIGGNIITSDSIKGVLSAGGTAWVGVLIQNFSASYQMQNSPVYELGSSRVYRRMGRPEGTMQIARILGINTALPVEEALFDVCQSGGTLTINAELGQCEGRSGGLVLTFGGLRASGYTFGADAQSLMSNESISLTFNYLSRAAI